MEIRCSTGFVGALKGQVISAQGNTLGINECMQDGRPVRAAYFS